MNSLQDGIFYNDADRPRKFFAILFFRINRDKNSKQVGEFLANLWNMYMNLKNGRIGDLPDHTIPHGDSEFLIAYGLSCFSIRGIKLNAPGDLSRIGTFRPASPGMPILTGSGLRYADEVSSNPAAEDIVVQVTSNNQLGVYRSIVETWKTIYDHSTSKENADIVSLVNFQTGFQRDDFRSWLDFHDGLSNMKSGNERLSVIKIKDIVDQDYLWAENSTYMVYLRLAIDLEVWRNLTRAQQEILVGRDKLTGCPIISIDKEGNPVPKEGCPAPGSIDISEGVENEKFRTSGDVSDKRLRESHISRAHHTSNEFAESVGSSRIFRQGYEFLENINFPPFFRAGLNFVSFQNSPVRFVNILTRKEWLGRTNFGGNPDMPIKGSNNLVSVLGAGIFFVPPKIESELFPGCRIFL